MTKQNCMHDFHSYLGDRGAQSKYTFSIFEYTAREAIIKDNIFWLLHSIMSDWPGRCISFVTEDYENIIYSFTLGNNFWAIPLNWLKIMSFLKFHKEVKYPISL